MDKISELSYLHLIAQLEEENKLLRDEAKHLRLTIKDYLNKKTHENQTGKENNEHVDRPPCPLLVWQVGWYLGNSNKNRPSNQKGGNANKQVQLQKIQQAVNYLQAKDLWVLRRSI